jgi:hypothetical protein
MTGHRWDPQDWDEPTREVVLRRLHEVPPLRFFTAEEVRTLEAAADRILPQGDRPPGQRVPIVPWIDEKLFDDRRDGYRYEPLPPQREAWRLGLAGIEQAAQARFSRPFTDLEPAAQEQVLREVQRGAAAGEAWASVPSARFFSALLVPTIVKIYYAHPVAWDEAGYHGPSSPRGHARKGMGSLDPWERR